MNQKIGEVYIYKYSPKWCIKITKIIENEIYYNWAHITGLTENLFFSTNAVAPDEYITDCFEYNEKLTNECIIKSIIE